MNPCDYIDNTIRAYEHQSPALISILTIATIVVVVLAVLFFKNRNQFPIKERSPYLSIASLLSLYVSFIKYLVPLLIFSIDDRSTTANNNIRMKTFMLFFFGGIGFSNFLISQFFKQLRLILAVRYHHLGRGIINLFKCETFLIKISILLSFSYSCFMETKRLYKHYDETCYENGQTYYEYNYDLIVEEALTSVTLYFCLTLQAVFLFGAFQLRNLRSEYNLQREQIETIGFLVIIETYYLIELYISNQRDNHTKQITLYYVTWGIFLIFTFISYIIPLLKCRGYHQMLTTSRILEEFELFIQEDYCVDAFEKFISQKNFTQSLLLSPLSSNVQTPDMNYHHQGSKEVLNFYFHVKQHLMINQQEIDTQFARSTIHQFKNRKHNIFEYLQQIEQLPKLKSHSEEEGMFENNEPKDVLLLYFTFAKEFLQKIYKNYYSKTVSFSMIKKILYFNERVNKNLEKLQMTEKNTAYQLI